ncbi:MAG: hypothetical protein WCS80_02935 [Bacilli bacterium]
MAWYWILLIVLASLIVLFFVGTFILYITNGDMKMVEKIYDKLIDYHDHKHTKEDI